MIIDCDSMGSVKIAFDDLYLNCESSNNGERIEKRMKIDQSSGSEDDDSKFKSKNLKAERKRRKKLSDRQLELRSLVPIFTNMNKATVITDAISYIELLQKNVKDRSEQLLEMDATFVKDEKTELGEIDTKSEMNKWGITPEVQVIHVDMNKLWIKTVFQKKEGGITRLIEAMSVLGFNLSSTSVTTSNGAVLVTSTLEGSRAGMQNAEQIKEFLLETIYSI